MDAINLATVMSPNILHDTLPGQAPSEAEAGDRLDVINVVRTMIDHCDDLFAVPVDVLDDVYAQLMDADPRQLDELCDMQLMLGGGVGGGGSREVAATAAAAPGMSVFSAKVETPEAPRRVYVRQEFMHQNTVRGGGESRNGGGASSDSSGVATVKR